MAELTLTRAAAALRTSLAKRGAQAKLTRKLRCAEGLVNRWLSGQRVPSAVQAAYLEAKFGIRVAWWGEPAADVIPDDAA